MLSAVNSPSLGDSVFEQLCAEIISGVLAAGEFLPPERELTVTFGVNRHVVRGAIQRLAQMRLVQVGRGGRTVVLDYERHAGLDLLYTLTKHARGRENVTRMWLSALQLRAAIGSDVLRLCALNRDDTLAEKLRMQAERMRAETDDYALRPIYGVFWDVALEGADNLAYRMAFNGLMQTVDSERDAAAPFVRQELEADDYHAAIVAAVAAHDGNAAELAARKSLRFHLDTYAALAKGRRTKGRPPRAAGAE